MATESVQTNAIEIEDYMDVVNEVQARATKIMAIAELLSDFPDGCSATSNAGWAMRDLAQEIHGIVESDKIRVEPQA